MNIKTITRYILFSAIPVADIGTVLVVNYFCGAGLTLLLVLISSLCGFAMCRRYLKIIKDRSDQLKGQYEGGIPTEVQLVNAHDICITLVLMLLFIYPGLLSDLIAWVLLIPRFQKSFSHFLLVGMKDEAKRQGKSLEELLKPKCLC